MTGREGGGLRPAPAHTLRLEPGERVEGHVLRLLCPGAPDGNSLLLRGADGFTYRMPATARKGCAVLERELEKVSEGSRVTIQFAGWRTTRDGEREYRHWKVTVR